MFERFTEDARRVVVEAQTEARDLGHGRIGTEHLLLAVLRTDPTSTEVLEPLALSYERVRREVASPSPAQRDALRNLGIDMDEVRRRVESQFGPGALDDPPRERRRYRRRARSGGGHIPFTEEARKALELSLRESIRLRSGDIRAAHVALGLLRDEGPVTAILHRLGVSAAAARQALEASLGRAA